MVRAREERCRASVFQRWELAFSVVPDFPSVAVDGRIVGTGYGADGWTFFFACGRKRLDRGGQVVSKGRDVASWHDVVGVVVGQKTLECKAA